MATGNFGGTVVFALSEEDRTLLNELLEQLEQLKHFTPPAVEVEVELETAQPAKPKPKQPKYTAADVQAKVQRLASPACGKRKEVKELISEYAERVSQIPEDKFVEIMQKLTELEEG